MKKFLLFLLLSVVYTISFCNAQTPVLYGATIGGGSSSIGDIFQTNGNIIYKNDFNFADNYSSNPQNNFIQASNGLLYSGAFFDNYTGLGSFISYNIITGNETNIHFSNLYGNPSSFILASNDNLYCTYSSMNFAGVYKLNPSNNQGQLVQGLSASVDPVSGLVQASNGSFYATTQYGGDLDGSIISIDTSTGVATDVYDFSASNNNGVNPNAALIEASNGLLYGTTYYVPYLGGSTIYSFNPATKAFTLLYTFPQTNYCISSLLQASNGILYGMTENGGHYGGGYIFSFDISTNTETNLYVFGSDTDDGLSPLGSLIQVNDSMLYGLTEVGGVYKIYNGDYDCGTIFSYNILSGQEKVLHSFGNGIDGALPYNSLFQANNGLLYAMTSSGGSLNMGTIFSFNTTNDSETVLFNFGVTPKGNQPVGTLTEGTDGLLYGLAGGGTNSGVLYSYNTSTDSETVVHNFGVGTDGQFPEGSVVEANNGLLYGMTSSGGTHDFGTIYSYSTTTGIETDLHDFDSIDGANPMFASLIQANDGQLYGMTNVGGANNTGTLFSYAISTGIETDLYNFGVDGGHPYGSLLQASNGLLYGSGGNSIFSYNIATGVKTDLDSNINSVYGALIQASNGLLYGSGGNIIFSYDITTGKDSTLFDINTNYELVSLSSVMQASNGLLYGIGYDGAGGGGVFSYNISTGASAETNIENNFSDNNYGYGNLIEVDSLSGTPLSVWPGDANDDLIVNNLDLLPVGLYYGQSGPQRNKITNTWAAQPANNWGVSQPNGFDLKYVDCNGDGAINSDDTLAITLNYGDTHLYHSPPFANNIGVPGGAPVYFISDSSTYQPGNTIHVAVWLGNSTVQATSIYGLGYDIYLNNSLIQPGTIAFNYDSSFIGSKNFNALSLTHIGNDVETAVTRIDHYGKSGYGKIGDLYFTLNPSISDSQLIISISSFEAVDSAGNILNLQPLSDTIFIENTTTSIKQLSVTNNQLSIYPNPSTGMVTVASSKNIDEIKVTNVLGELVYEATPKQNQFNFELRDEGMYFVTVMTGGNVSTSKIIVNK